MTEALQTALWTNETIGYTRIDDLDREPFPVINECLLLCGDAEKALALLPSRSIQTVVTSPPYWSLRDYQTEDQIGCDDSLDAYVARVVEAFEEVRRVLRNDGTVWLNVGDVYTSGNRRYRAPDKKNRARAMAVRPPTPNGLKPKDLFLPKVREGPRGDAAPPQDERTTGVGAGPPDQGTRDCFPVVEGAGLPLR